MTKTYRELTGKEKRQIKKLVVSKCANYDKVLSGKLIAARNCKLKLTF